MFGKFRGSTKEDIAVGGIGIESLLSGQMLRLDLESLRAFENCFAERIAYMHTPLI